MDITTTVAMLGSAGNGGSFSADPFIARFSGFAGFCQDIAVDEDNYIYSLWYPYPATNYQVILIKTDPSDGSVVWSKRKYYSSNSTLGYALAYGNNSVYVAVRNITADRGDVLRFDLDGNLTHQCRLSDTRFTLYMTVNANGDVCLFGEVAGTAAATCITMDATLSTIIRNDNLSGISSRANSNLSNSFMSDGVSTPVWSYANYHTYGGIYNTDTGAFTQGYRVDGGAYDQTASCRTQIVDLSDNVIHNGAWRASSNQHYGHIVSLDPATNTANWGYQFRNNSNTQIGDADIQPDTGQIVICGDSDGGVYPGYAAEHGYVAIAEEDGTRTASLEASAGAQSIRASRVKNVGGGNYFAVAWVKGDRSGGNTFNGNNMSSYISLIDISDLPSGTYLGVPFSRTTSGWYFNSQSNRSSISTRSPSSSSVTRSKTSVSYSDTSVSYGNSALSNW